MRPGMIATVWVLWPAIGWTSYEWRYIDMVENCKRFMQDTGVRYYIEWHSQDV